MNYEEEMLDELVETIENMNAGDIIALRNDTVYMPMEQFNLLVAGERSYVEVVNDLDDDFDRRDEYYWQGQEETQYKYHSGTAEDIINSIDIYELAKVVSEGFEQAYEYPVLREWIDKMEEYKNNK